MHYFIIPDILYTQLVPPMDCSEKTEFYFKKKTTEICKRTNYDAIIAVSTLYYREFDIVVKVDDLDDLYSMFYALMRNYDLNLSIWDDCCHEIDEETFNTLFVRAVQKGLIAKPPNYMRDYCKYIAKYVIKNDFLSWENDTSIKTWSLYGEDDKDYDSCNLQLCMIFNIFHILTPQQVEGMNDTLAQLGDEVEDPSGVYAKYISSDQVFLISYFGEMAFVTKEVMLELMDTVDPDDQNCLVLERTEGVGESLGNLEIVRRRIYGASEATDVVLLPEGLLPVGLDMSCSCKISVVFETTPTHNKKVDINILPLRNMAKRCVMKQTNKNGTTLFVYELQSLS